MKFKKIATYFIKNRVIQDIKIKVVKTPILNVAICILGNMYKKV
jgi:hypothetical protein